MIFRINLVARQKNFRPALAFGALLNEFLEIKRTNLQFFLTQSMDP